MSSAVRGWLGNRRFDVDAAVLGFVLAVLLFPLRFLASEVYIETIPLVLGGACGLYLLAVRADRFSSGMPRLSRPAGKLFPSLALLSIAALILVGVESGGRTLPFYALAGITGSLVAIQVLFTDEPEFSAGLLLTEILLLAFVVRYTALYTTPGLVGIDIWTHITQLAGSIRAEGSLSAIQGNKHFASPLFHLLVVETATLADVSLRSALYLSVGLAMPFAVLLVYSTANLLVDQRWAVLAALLYSLADHVIKWGIHLIPTSHGLVFFLAVLYALVRIMRVDYGVRDFGLLVFLSVALILTHQVSSFIMLVLIGAALLAQVALSIGLFTPPRGRGSVRKRPVNLLGLMVFDMGFIIFMWSLTPYNRGTFLLTVLSYLRETVRSSAGFLNLAGGSSGGGASDAASQTPTLLKELLPYVNTMGFLLLLLVTFIGCLYVIQRDHTRHSVLTLLVAAAVMLVFVLGLPMFGIRNFIPQRWFAFLFAPMAILGVVGLRHLAENLGSTPLVAGLLLFSLVFPGAMVITDDATIDSPAFPTLQTRTGYTDQELAAVTSIGTMTGSPDSANLLPREVISTDQPYRTVFRRRGQYPARAAVVWPENGTLANSSVTVYRRYQSTGAPIFDRGDGIGRVHRVSKETMCPAGHAVLYTNGDVTMCVDPATAAAVDEGATN